VPYYCGKLVNKMSKPTFLIHVSSHFVLQSEHKLKKNIVNVVCGYRITKCFKFN
jgi:hypothetical protein